MFLRQLLRYNIASQAVTEIHIVSQAVTEIQHCFSGSYRLVGLVVKVSASGEEIRSSIPVCEVGIFQDRVIPVTEKNDTSLAILPGAWRYRVSAGTLTIKSLV